MDSGGDPTGPRGAATINGRMCVRPAFRPTRRERAVRARFAQRPRRANPQAHWPRMTAWYQRVFGFQHQVPVQATDRPSLYADDRFWPGSVGPRHPKKVRPAASRSRCVTALPSHRKVRAERDRISRCNARPTGPVLRRGEEGSHDARPPCASALQASEIASRLIASPANDRITSGSEPYPSAGPTSYRRRASAIACGSSNSPWRS